MMTTYEHARRCDSGQIFRDCEGNRAIYDNRSDGTKEAFGYPIQADGTRGRLGKLPDNMRPERYNITAAHEFAYRVKRMGFVVYMGGAGHYGIISDEKGERVLSFEFPGVNNSLSGHYGPPSRESGTGWRLEQAPESLLTIDDVRRALYAHPPRWCGKGWKNMITLEQHLATYERSSGYRLFGEERKAVYRRGLDDYDLIRNAASDPLQIPAVVTEQEYHEMLGCVPPLYAPGASGFLVGEPLTSDKRGTVYANYFQSSDGTYYARYHVIKK